jgi:arginyl-tRNA synthetase
MVMVQSETLIQCLKTLIKKAIRSDGVFLTLSNIDIKSFRIEIEKIKNSDFGDYSTNAFMLMNLSKEDVVKYGKKIASALAMNKKVFQKVVFAEPGFINMTVSNNLLSKYVQAANTKKNKYGSFKRKKLFYNLEFVSANPTGLMHIGHARNAAFGDTLCNI